MRAQPLIAVGVAVLGLGAVLGWLLFPADRVELRAGAPRSAPAPSRPQVLARGAMEGVPEGPIAVVELGGRLFVPRAVATAPAGAYQVLWNEAMEQFGRPPPPVDPETALRRKVFIDEMEIVHDAMWVLRDHALIEDVDQDLFARQQIQLRSVVVYSRGGGPDELAWAVSGAQAECESGLTLKAPAARKAAQDCLDALAYLTGVDGEWR